ncbi:hypothetical protein T4E_7026 [Trichinella pseudospiralis]|uniref:Uncharacterized protein n=1 Tax=Trichinella pseudospiralis TaxID=6337 RepID=A0A0V0XLQ5_TRIPS|nr:hypothetical protein T4E_7026 [Trichinella pseudospiralis]
MSKEKSKQLSTLLTDDAERTIQQEKSNQHLLPKRNQFAKWTSTEIVVKQNAHTVKPDNSIGRRPTRSIIAIAGRGAKKLQNPTPTVAHLAVKSSTPASVNIVLEKTIMGPIPLNCIPNVTANAINSIRLHWTFRSSSPMLTGWITST